jgi:site-specific recombinase XerC
MNADPTLAPLLERFFTQRLMTQRQVSAHTIASYRDTFTLLLALRSINAEDRRRAYCCRNSTHHSSMAFSMR